jgi:hypothetical protein
MQALLQQLRPAPLEHTSLLEALHTQAQALEFRAGAAVHVDLAPLPEPDRLLPGTQEAIFRLVQEAFANIARHARARTIWRTLQTVGQSLRVTVRDDGQGFDPAQARAGMGLANLRERTQTLHGNLVIRSQRGAGTTVLISIPLLEALPSPAEAARQQYNLARADDLARHGYRLCTNAAFLTTALGMVGVINGWNSLLGLSVLAALLVTLYSYARGGYHRARVAAGTNGESRTALELAQKHYSAGLSLLLPASLGIFYLFKPAGTGKTPAMVHPLPDYLGNDLRSRPDLWAYPVRAVGGHPGAAQRLQHGAQHAAGRNWHSVEQSTHPARETSAASTRRRIAQSDTGGIRWLTPFAWWSWTIIR